MKIYEDNYSHGSYLPFACDLIKPFNDCLNKTNKYLEENFGLYIEVKPNSLMEDNVSSSIGGWRRITFLSTNEIYIAIQKYDDVICATTDKISFNEHEDEFIMKDVISLEIQHSNHYIDIDTNGSSKIIFISYDKSKFDNFILLG